MAIITTTVLWKPRRDRRTAESFARTYAAAVVDRCATIAIDTLRTPPVAVAADFNEGRTLSVASSLIFAQVERSPSRRYRFERRSAVADRVVVDLNATEDARQALKSTKGAASTEERASFSAGAGR